VMAKTRYSSSCCRA